MQTPSGTPDCHPIPMLDNNLTQECKNLISSLPAEKGWVASDTYQYQGFWYPPKILQSVIKVHGFEAQDEDVILVTNPKCGTTWLKALSFALVNRGKYQCSSQNHPLLTSNPHLLVPLLELNQWYQTADTDFSGTQLSSRLIATHMPYVSLPQSVKDKSCKIVYLWRDPKDVLISLWQFGNKLRGNEKGDIQIDEAFDKFCRGINAFGPFWDHVLSYWNASLENPNKFLFLRYEEMKEQPRTQLKRLADFMGCKFSEEEEANGSLEEILKPCSFDSLRNMEVNKHGNLPTGIQTKVFFRKGEIGDWKNYLTSEMAETIDQITTQKLIGSGFKI